MEKDLMEKYEDMTDEEYKTLSKEEKAKIDAEIAAYTKKMEEEGKANVEEMKKAVGNLTDEEKSEMKKQMEEAQKLAAKKANYSEAERLADMMDPSTAEYTEEELIKAQEVMENYPELTAEEAYQKEMEHMMNENKKGFWQIIKDYFKRIF